MIGFAAGGPEHSRNAAGNRGRGVDPVHWPWRQPSESIDQQWIMRAGQHDGVGARRIVLALPNKTWREFGRYPEVVDLDAAQCRLGQRSKLRRADQRHFAALREIADQRLGVFALDGTLGA